MEEGWVDVQLSDTDSQASGLASNFSEGQPEEWPVTPAAPAAILMKALLAITQALKLSRHLASIVKET